MVFAINVCIFVAAAVVAWNIIKSDMDGQWQVLFCNMSVVVTTILMLGVVWTANTQKVAAACEKAGGEWTYMGRGGGKRPYCLRPDVIIEFKVED